MRTILNVPVNSVYYGKQYKLSVWGRRLQAFGLHINKLLRRRSEKDQLNRFLMSYEKELTGSSKKTAVSCDVLFDYYMRKRARRLLEEDARENASLDDLTKDLPISQFSRIQRVWRKIRGVSDLALAGKKLGKERIIKWIPTSRLWALAKNKDSKQWKEFNRDLGLAIRVRSLRVTPSSPLSSQSKQVLPWCHDLTGSIEPQVFESFLSRIDFSRPLTVGEMIISYRNEELYLQGNAKKRPDFTFDESFNLLMEKRFHLLLKDLALKLNIPKKLIRVMPLNELFKIVEKHSPNFGVETPQMIMFMGDLYRGLKVQLMRKYADLYRKSMGMISESSLMDKKGKWIEDAWKIPLCFPSRITIAPEVAAQEFLKAKATWAKDEKEVFSSFRRKCQRLAVKLTGDKSELGERRFLMHLWGKMYDPKASIDENTQHICTTSYEVHLAPYYSAKLMNSARDSAQMSRVSDFEKELMKALTN